MNTSASEPTMHLSPERYHAELADEREFLTNPPKPEGVDSVLRAEIAAHNSRRSKLINLKGRVEAWDADPAPIVDRSGVQTKLINGVEVPDPFVAGAATFNLTAADRAFEKGKTIKPSMFAPKAKKQEGPPPPPPLGATVMKRFGKLRNVTCQEWKTKLDLIDDVTLRARIAKLIWWDFANRLKQQDCVLTELVNMPLSIPQIKSYSVEQVAIELWRVGWPARLATERAQYAQQ